MPLTTVTSVVEPIFAVPVGEFEFEVDEKSGAEVEGIGVILEKIEVVEVFGMESDEDDINVDSVVGVVAIVGVDGSGVIDVTGNDIVLIFFG